MAKVIAEFSATVRFQLDHCCLVWRQSPRAPNISKKGMILEKILELGKPSRNKIKIINRCDLMLQNLKHFKTVIIQKCPKCPEVQSVLSVQDVQGVQGVSVHSAIHSSCPLDN